jgi:hypothetical protein
MAIDRNDGSELQARIDAFIEEFRAAQQRRLVQRGIALWNRAETAHAAMTLGQPPPPERLH